MPLCLYIVCVHNCTSYCRTIGHVKHIPVWPADRLGMDTSNDSMVRSWLRSWSLKHWNPNVVIVLLWSFQWDILKKKSQHLAISDPVTGVTSLLERQNIFMLLSSSSSSLPDCYFQQEVPGQGSDCRCDDCNIAYFVFEMHCIIKLCAHGCVLLGFVVALWSVCWGFPLYVHGLTWIPAWISNHICEMGLLIHP